MILADASVWIDYLGGKATSQADRLDTLIDSGQFGVADLTLTEVLQGIRDQSQYERTLFRLVRLPLLTIGGRDIAVQAASNYRILRARGFTVRKTIDTLIATRCIIDDHALLFSDHDFAPFVEHLGLRDAMAD